MPQYIWFLYAFKIRIWIFFHSLRVDSISKIYLVSDLSWFFSLILRKTTKQTPKNEAVLCCLSKIVYGTDKAILNITLVTVTQKWVTCWIYWVKANESYSFILDNIYSFDLLTFFFDEIKKKSRYRNFWRILLGIS